MEIKLYPAYLRGSVCVPVSKSLLHRHLICQSLAGEYTELPDASDDIGRTVQALAALQKGETVIDCGGSGSTLRFLLPLAMVKDVANVMLTGDKRLLERPVPAVLPMERTDRGWRVTGNLTPGTYRLAADETSQLISGLLMALPLLEKPSKIMLTTAAVSAPYLNMTLAVMAQHGVVVKKTETGYNIPAPQIYQKAELPQEGDWSAAAWYVVINALQGGKVEVQNTVFPSLQGDCAIVRYLAAKPDIIDISQTPDLLPPLALWASLQTGKEIHFTDAAFLRGKESDRLRHTARILNVLGGQVTEEADGLSVCGVSTLRGGGTVDSCGDHRMAMLAAFAAALCQRPVTLTGAECVSKSYPGFWRDYTALGGNLEETKP